MQTSQESRALRISPQGYNAAFKSTIASQGFVFPGPRARSEGGAEGVRRGGVGEAGRGEAKVLGRGWKVNDPQSKRCVPKGALSFNEFQCDAPDILGLDARHRHSAWHTANIIPHWGDHPHHL
jgi:hypothetical protein